MSNSHKKENTATSVTDRDLEVFSRYLPLSSEIYRHLLEGYSFLSLRKDAVQELEEIPEPVFPEATELDKQDIKYSLNKENESLAIWAFNSFNNTFYEKNRLPVSRKKRSQKFLRDSLDNEGLPFSKNSDLFNLLVFIESRLQKEKENKSKLSVGTVMTVVNSIKSYHFLLSDSQYKGLIDKKEITSLYTVATALDLINYRQATDKPNKRLLTVTSGAIVSSDVTVVRCVSSVLETLSEKSLKRVKNSLATYEGKVGHLSETWDWSDTRRAVKRHIISEFKKAGVRVPYLQFIYSGLSGWGSDSALHARNESAIYEALFKELVGDLGGAPAKRYATLLIPEGKLNHKTVREFYITLRREYSILRAFGEHPETLKSKEDNPSELAFIKSILEIP